MNVTHLDSKTEARQAVEQLRAALVQFVSLESDHNDGSAIWREELKHIAQRADLIAAHIDREAALFADDYHLIEVEVQSIHYVWVKGGDRNQANHAAADYVSANFTAAVVDQEHHCAEVVSTNDLETRSAQSWDLGENADIEI